MEEGGGDRGSRGGRAGRKRAIVMWSDENGPARTSGDARARSERKRERIARARSKNGDKRGGTKGMKPVGEEKRIGERRRKRGQESTNGRNVSGDDRRATTSDTGENDKAGRNGRVASG